MTHGFNRIRELAPSNDGGAEYLYLREIIGTNIGHVIVETSDEVLLGSVDLGGTLEARLIVDQVGLSTKSGGYLYRPLAFMAPEVEHYFLYDLPDTRFHTEDLPITVQQHD